jgi:two-component system cell cycle response regulator
MTDDQQELRGVRRQLKLLKEEASNNEQILRRSQAREMELLEADSLPMLLARLTTGLKSSYQLQAMSLVLTDPEHEIRHLLMAAGERPNDYPQVQFVDTTYSQAPQLANARRPWLGSYRAADHQLLFPQVTPASIALLPLSRQDRLIGCLCFGSADSERFTHRHSADFLHHLGVIASFALENVVNRARLIRSGLIDVLTGWHNRRYLQTRLGEELARARRDGTPLVCLMVDVDHFKNVNDRHGHLVGDEVLREIAHRLELQVRASDVSARFGGEEFVILLPNTKLADAQILAERVRHTVASEPIEAGIDAVLNVTVSIGLTELRPVGGEDDLKIVGDHLLAQADVALYEAKAAGRNTVVAR